MISLTRAIDTLVINVSEGESVIKDALRRAMTIRPDCVEWLYAPKVCMQKQWRVYNCVGDDRKT
jgi:hypothetical protein